MRPYALSWTVADICGSAITCMLPLPNPVPLYAGHMKPHFGKLCNSLRRPEPFNQASKPSGFGKPPGRGPKLRVQSLASRGAKRLTKPSEIPETPKSLNKNKELESQHKGKQLSLKLQTPDQCAQTPERTTMPSGQRMQQPGDFAQPLSPSLRVEDS